MIIIIDKYNINIEALVIKDLINIIVAIKIKGDDININTFIVDNIFSNKLIFGNNINNISLQFAPNDHLLRCDKNI